MRFNATREMTALLLTASKNFNVGMHSDVYEMICFKVGMVVDTIKHYILKLVCVTLNFIQDHRNARTEKTLAPVIAQSFQLIWMKFGVLWRLGVMNLIIVINILSIRIQGREPYLCDFVGLHSDIYRPIFFSKLGMMLETTKLHFDISVDYLDLQLRSQLYEKSKASVSIFSKISVSLDEIQYVTTTC